METCGGSLHHVFVVIEEVFLSECWRGEAQLVSVELSLGVRLVELFSKCLDLLQVFFQMGVGVDE